MGSWLLTGQRHYFGHSELSTRGASIIDVDSIGEGGGQPKVDYGSKLLVINESIKEGGGSKSRKN